MTQNSYIRLNGIANNILHLLMNRPSFHNAFNTQLANELIMHCQHINESNHIRAVIISGEGRSFCSGADLKERQSLKTSKQWMEQHHIFELMFDSLAKLKHPTIACVEGFSLGRCYFVEFFCSKKKHNVLFIDLAGGFELALNCDMIVASRTAIFGLPEVTRGIMPGGGGTQLLTRLVGPARAKHITLTGRRITAQEAYDMGIVQILTDENESLKKGIELATNIATNAPLATRAIKQAIDEGWGKNTEEAKAVELKYYEQLIDSEDRQEGIQAFNEKRKPQWKGN